ncbi:hypothetical protein [Filomicrobium sp.]|uniref:hypothetical protein n=1 Tax=Filomicrobium sp. TaxID=2024831 RepID=UPI0025902A7D|nr:hypothetical protein [Filomicrobium sp.]
MLRAYRLPVSILLSLTLSLAPVLEPLHAQTSIPLPDIEACKAQDEEAFRSAIKAVTTSALRTNLGTVDYDALVAEQWRKNNVSQLIDDRVDIAVAEVRDESSWGTLLKSLAYKEQAQKLATEVAERVYRSDAMKTAIADLATAVGLEVGGRIEQATRDASQPALQCLQSYLGPRYGATVSAIVRDDAQRDFAGASDAGGADISAGSILRESSAGITGAAILLVRRQLANLARSVGQRMVGSVLSRLVSVVAGGVGLVLIAKDLWDLRYGVLPIIASEMKSDASKDQVRAELAKSLSEQMRSHVDEIGAAAADRVVEVWRDFRSAHLKALELAETNQEFRTFLDNVRQADLGRLDEVVGLVLASEGETGVLTRLENGTLNEAITSLPEPAMEIARATRSLETALKWSAVAGNNISAVVEYGIYQQASPDSFSTYTLQRVLALKDRIAIARLAGVNRDAREILLELGDSSLLGLSRSLTSDELATLSSYLTGLKREPRERVLRAVAASPAKMQVLASEGVRNAVVASSDQNAAVEMMLRNDTSVDPTKVASDFKLVWDGRVSPSLLVNKHPLSLGALAVALVILLLLLRRLFSVRRPSKIGTDA